MVKRKHVSGMSNRLLYTLIAVGLLAIFAVGVWAYNPSNSPPAVPSVFGHSSNELDFSNGINGLPSLSISSSTANPRLTLDASSSANLANMISFERSGSARWQFVGSSGDSGVDNLFISRFSDSGTYIDSPLIIQRSTGNIGIGTTNSTSKLSVNGGAGVSGVVTASGFSGDGSGITNLVVRLSGAGTCNSASDGLLRYQSGICSADDVRSSSLDMCMKISNSVYDWQNVKTNTWADSSCDTNGCPAGQQYYSCTGWRADPGCYTNQPFGCYCNQGDDPSICESF